MTAFIKWQDRLGLPRAVDAAASLGVTRQAVALLRAGKRQPSGPMARLMEIIERNPDLAIRQPR